MVHLTTALDASSGVPLYEQLYRSLAGEMRSGTLAAGTRMPGKRRLAAELSVSVNTVDAAYQMLAAEGYLESRERSGFYVQEYLALPSRPAGGPEQPAPPKPELPVLPVRYDLSTRSAHGRGCKRSCSILRPSCSPTAMRRATRPCGRRWRNISLNTAVCSAGRIRSWWARDWNICWACWHRCCPALQRWKRRATPVLCRCCRTTVCTAAAYRWTRTAFRWKH